MAVLEEEEVVAVAVDASARWKNLSPNLSRMSAPLSSAHHREVVGVAVAVLEEEEVAAVAAAKSNSCSC